MGEPRMDGAARGTDGLVRTVQGYRFSSEDLAVGQRRPGISAFMRVRNGADFLEPTILSHLPFFDEIVIVYNQCTDDTGSIASRLARQHPDKIRVFHYVDRVYPPGHPAYVSLPQESPSSMGTYSNFALAQTRCTVATKLDDDHVCIPRNLQPLVDAIRRKGCRLGAEMLCFSGLNLVREHGELAIVERNPFSGNGDIGFFEVSASTIFRHTPKFEVFDRRRLRRRYAGLVYLHCKYLKRGHGFDNYELDENPRSRYLRQWAAFQKGHAGVGLAQFRSRYARLGWLGRIAPLLPEKLALRATRASMLHRETRDLDLASLMDRAVAQ